MEWGYAGRTPENGYMADLFILHLSEPRHAKLQGAQSSMSLGSLARENKIIIIPFPSHGLSILKEYEQ